MALSLLNLRFANPSFAARGAGGLAYRSSEDIYRERWTWDRVAKGTHYVNCGYQRGCAWNVYVKDGVVWREEQIGDYEQTNADVPDFNPRGCQKGACYSDRMYDAGRLTHPLKRVGKRGEGNWKRISWDQALGEIADRTIDAMVSEQDGPGSIYWDLGSGMSNGCHALGLTRTGYVLDTPILENTTEIGDHMPGVTTTTGKLVFNSSMDDLHYSDLILIWGGNPNYTHIPNAHFIYEARYNGAYVVTITPDYNPSAIHADEWMSVNMGSDAALALSMAQVIVEEKLYKPDFMAEQTDMPLLVRQDNGEFLRERDVEHFGDDDGFYVFDTVREKIVDAPKRSLALDGIKPALEGVYTVETLSGPVQVTTVFERLKLQLRDYRPEQTQATTGVAPAGVRKLARRIASAKACSNVCQTNFSKYYHGMEMERGVLLVFALTGQFGRRGAGYSAIPQLSVSGAAAFTPISGKYSPKLGVALMTAPMAPKMLQMKLAGYSDEMLLYQMARLDYARGNLVATPLFHYQHGGLKELYGGASKWDPHVERDFQEYLDEAVDQGWQFVPGGAPRIMFSAGGNMFRRVRGYHKLMEHMLPKLDLLVTIDWRMSNTALYSDYVLPAAGWYEKDDITWASAMAPFSHVTTAAVDPVADSKTDWEFHCLFLKKMQERARARGIETFVDRHGGERRLDEVYDEFTFQGRFREDNPEDLLDEILAMTTNLGDANWEQLKEKGYLRFTGLGMNPTYIGNAADIEPDQTIVSNSWHVQKKIPWPTLTRRMQFYIDHPFYKELGEVLPVHKDNPAIGGDYPLQMTGGHARWSIHSMWRDQRLINQLQRGEPAVFVGTNDAKARGIADGATVRVYNDVGEFEIQAKVSRALKPGQVVVYHGWEPFQFKGNKSHQALIPSPLNPIQLAGGYFHLQPMVLMQSPGCTDRGTRVEVERAKSA
ncbi:MAG: molybdopterin-dependent oxidoreductase [bacterium]|nr:molybdopterin-dependent oxidoreductase [bacterium]